MIGRYQRHDMCAVARIGNASLGDAVSIAVP